MFLAPCRLLRNITGKAFFHLQHNKGYGCFKDVALDSTKPRMYWAGSDPYFRAWMEFDANANSKGTVSSEDSPMAGHATGPDVHPYAVSLTPMIAI